jgi:cytochrome c553
MNRMTIRSILSAMTVGLILFFIAGEGTSQEARTIAGNIKAGRAAAQICIACHGTEGISVTAKTPHLAGQHASYIVRALGYYQSGERREASMEAIAREVSDGDMANLAAYYAGLKPFASSAVKRSAKKAAALQAAEEGNSAAMAEATAECAGCHGDDGNSTIPGWPGLAGQPPQYLMTALKAYREGTRPDPAMQTFTAPLDDAAIEEMAFYYAAMKPLAAEPPTTGDPYAGRAATRDCAACHGPNGNSKDPATPRLAGLDAEYIGATIRAYKNGARSHAAMQEAVAAVREADIADISAFYATRTPKALPMRKRLTTAGWVENCNRCHGPGGESTDPRFPVLAGQSEAYLVAALKRYHNGDRANSMMFAMSYPMSEADIRKLAAYYAYPAKNREGNK